MENKKKVGRPATGTRRKFNFRAEKEVEEYLNGIENKSAFINACIKKAIDI